MAFQFLKAGQFVLDVIVCYERKGKSLDGCEGKTRRHYKERASLAGTKHPYGSSPAGPGAGAPLRHLDLLARSKAHGF